MARPLRIEFPGALYHVTARGNGRQLIYLDEDDCSSFLEVVAETVARFAWLCHAYCLMPNHYHLVVETPRANLARGMRHVNGVYAQRFNRRRRRVGHLFQGRYRAVLVEKEAHLLELVRYVVLNPVRAGLCGHPGEWPRSSYRATAGESSALPFLTPAWLLAQFAPTRKEAEEAFRRFVADGSARPFAEAKGEIYLGSEEFVRRHAPGKVIPEVPRAQAQPHRPPLAELLAGRGADAIAQAYREYGYRLGEIAAYLGVHYSTVSRRLRAAEGGE